LGRPGRTTSRYARRLSCPPCNSAVTGAAFKKLIGRSLKPPKPSNANSPVSAKNKILERALAHAFAHFSSRAADQLGLTSVPPATVVPPVLTRVKAHTPTPAAPTSRAISHGSKLPTVPSAAGARVAGAPRSAATMPIRFSPSPKPATIACFCADVSDGSVRRYVARLAASSRCLTIRSEIAIFRGSPPFGNALIVDEINAAWSTGAAGVALVGTIRACAKTGTGGKPAATMAATPITAVSFRTAYPPFAHNRTKHHLHTSCQLQCAIQRRKNSMEVRKMWKKSHSNRARAERAGHCKRLEFRCRPERDKISSIGDARGVAGQYSIVII